MAHISKAEKYMAFRQMHWDINNLVDSFHNHVVDGSLGNVKEFLQSKYTHTLADIIGNFRDKTDFRLPRTAFTTEDKTGITNHDLMGVYVNDKIYAFIDFYNHDDDPSNYGLYLAVRDANFPAPLVIDIEPRAYGSYFFKYHPSHTSQLKRGLSPHVKTLKLEKI